MDELRTQMAAAHEAQERAAAVPRLQLELVVARGNFEKTLHLIRALKAGAVRLEQVVLDGDNWSVLDPAQVPVLIPDPPAAG